MKISKDKVKNGRYRVSDDHVQSSYVECLKKDLQGIPEYKSLDFSMNKYILGDNMMGNLNVFDHIEEGFL